MIGRTRFRGRARHVFSLGFLLLSLAPPAVAQDVQPLIDEGRAAAQQDQNVQARDLFEQALTLDPARRPELLREYADQLSYTRQAEEAIPLYREALTANLGGEERARAQTGLARALSWTGRHEEAADLWQQRQDADPSNQEARRGLREALVAQARAEAAEARPAEAAALLERAMAADPSARAGLLREYADQLTYGQQAGRAIPVYDEAIGSSGISPEEQALTRRNRAFALLWSSDPQAEAAWAELAAEDPDDAEAAANLRALRAQAPSAPRRRAAPARVDAPTPARPSAVPLLTQADDLMTSGRAAEAVPLFRRALDIPLTPDRRREALLGLARAQSWSGDNAGAGATYDALLAIDPADAEARRGQAMILTWTGRSAEGQRIFDELLVADPGDNAARRGAAEARMYQGRQREALRLLSPLLVQDDPEAQSLAARAELWRGRPDRAVPLANAALEDRPYDTGAADAAREAARQLRPRTDLTLALSRQDNGLQTVTQELRHRVFFNEGRSSAAVVEQLSHLRHDTGDVRVLTLGISGTHAWDEDLALEGSLTAARINSGGQTRVRPLFDGALRYQARDELRFDLFTSRSLFDDRSSVAAGVTMTTLGLGAEVQGVWRLALRGGLGFVSDGNRRLFAEGAAERQVPGLPVFLGLRHSYQGFTRPDRSRGYLNPDWIHTTALTARFENELAHGWTFGADGSAGYEWQTDQSQPVWGAGLWVRYDANDRASFSADLRHQDSAALAGAQGFWRTTGTFRLGLRW